MSSIPTATTSAATTKFKIEQKVPSGAIRKGPYAVERSIDPNDVVIKRRFDEGTRPIFQRQDITINRNGNSFESRTVPKAELNTKQHLTRQNSTDSSSPERYRRRDDHSKHLTNQPESPHSTKYAQTTKRIAPVSRARKVSVSPPKKRSPEKVPYFADEKREKDRLRRLYSAEKAKTAVTTSPRRHKTSITSNYSSSRQRRSKSKDRYSSPTHADTNSRSRYHRSRSRSRERVDKRRRRSLSSGRHRSDHHYKPSASSTRTHSTTTTHLFSRHHRPRSRSRSKSYDKHRDRDRRRRHNRRSSRETEYNYRHEQHSHEQSLALAPTQQFIPIPVPVPADYPYAFSTWPPQHAWPAPPPHTMAPTRFTPYPLALPPSSMYRPLVPPRLFRPMLPQRFTTPNYGASRTNRGSYRPRNT